MPAWGNCASTWNPASLPESARLACPPVCQRVSRSGPLRQRFPDLPIGLNRALDTTPCPLRPVERTLVLLKPDSAQRGLVGRILTRFEEKGLKLIGLKMRQFPEEHLRKHYAVHAERPFFDSLVSYMGSGPVVALVLEGLEAVSVVRGLVGATNGRESAPGTIRGDFGMSFSNNLVHASDSCESAAMELALWFPDGAELVDWSPADLEWRYNVGEELA